MRSFNTKLALESHSRMISSAVAFGGDKSGTFKAFIDGLVSEISSGPVEKKQVSLQDIVAMGQQVQAQIDQESDEQRADREANEAAMTNLFSRYKEKQNFP